MTRDELRDYLVRKFDLSPQDMHLADEALGALDSYVHAERDRIAEIIAANSQRTIGSYSDGLSRAARIVRGSRQG